MTTRLEPARQLPKSRAKLASRVRGTLDAARDALARPARYQRAARYVATGLLASVGAASQLLGSTTVRPSGPHSSRRRACHWDEPWARLRTPPRARLLLRGRRAPSRA